MVGDRDLLAFRQGHYDLFVSLLWKEPAGALVAGLAEGIAERIRSARNLHRALAEGWEEIERFLGAGAPTLVEAVADEYTRLFIGPHEPQVYMYESYYLAGRLLDRPLAALRSYLGQVGMERESGYPEPEDFLPFELDVMRRLIRRQAAAGDPDAEMRWLTLQADFLKQHLLVWGIAVAKDMAGARGASFFKGVGRLLHGFLELEREFFAGWGMEEVPSLDEARQAFAARQEWRGPLLDFGQESVEPAGP